MVSKFSTNPHPLLDLRSLLLPNAYGADLRENLYAEVGDVYDGITDVRYVGDWRRGVVPAPAGAKMMYLK